MKYPQTEKLAENDRKDKDKSTEITTAKFQSDKSDKKISNAGDKIRQKRGENKPAGVGQVGYC